MISFSFFFPRWASAAWLTGVAATAAGAVTLEGAQPRSWANSVSVVQHAVADGLPVFALGRADWPQKVLPGNGQARAAQLTEAKWLAHHPSGWRLGAVARSHASVKASQSSLALAKALDSKSFPSSDTTFGLSAQHAGWRGRGLEVGMPWQAVGDSGWQWTADAQWLQLTDLRTTRIDGWASYLAGAKGYDFDLSTERADTRIKGPFLRPAGPTGAGVSLSLGIRGEIRPGWMLSVRADDLASRLSWASMTQEQLRLNTQVTRLRPDGFLDYDAAITGRQSSGAVTSRMGARWDTQLKWQYAPAAAASARWLKVAGMDELWLGWNAKLAESSVGMHLGYEIKRQAVAARLSWRGAYVLLSTDGRGSQSEQRQIGLGWHLQF